MHIWESYYSNKNVTLSGVLCMLYRVLPLANIKFFLDCLSREVAASIHDHHCISQKRLSSFSSIQPITKKKACLHSMYTHTFMFRYPTKERLKREKHGSWMILLCRASFPFKVQGIYAGGTWYALFLVLGLQHSILSIIISF